MANWCWPSAAASSSFRGVASAPPHQAAEDVGRGDGAHPAARLAERRRPGEGESVRGARGQVPSGEPVAE
eukprot:8949473-Pyramimonas_sp.AAC.1